MLLEADNRGARTVAVLARNRTFKRLFQEILAEWKVPVVEDPKRARLVFAERGLSVSDISGEVVWLTPMPLAEGQFLMTPIKLSQLFRLLKKDSFPCARLHIRVSMDTQGVMVLDAGSQGCRLISLSDRGARLVCEQDVQLGTPLVLEVTILNCQLRLPAKVIYTIPPGDVSGYFRPQIGILFNYEDNRFISKLRNCVERTLIESGCDRAGISLKDPSLNWFDLPDGPEMDGSP